MDLTEAEDIKKRWQEYTEELCKNDLHDPDNHDGVITRLEPVHHSEESYLNWRKRAHSRKDPEQPKINTYMIFKKHFLKKESEWDPP